MDQTIPVSRILDRLDQLLAKKDFSAAEEHLRYWLSEAEAVGDERGRLSMLNEQIGFYRKQEREQDALKAAEAALAQAEKAVGRNSSVMATTLVNAATAFKAFGQAERALPLYAEARVIYELELSPTDSRLGGLYNNMALALTDLERWDEAEALFRRALDVMEQVENGEIDCAITFCNLADLYCAKLGSLDGEEQIFACLEKAMQLLDTEGLPRSDYYAFVCEKCAPCFGYYGFFIYENELKERAKAFYEGT